MQPPENREEKLKSSLRKIVNNQDLKTHQEWVKSIASEFGVSVLQCAAALSFYTQPDLAKNKTIDCNLLTNQHLEPELPISFPKPKLVRYRLNVGRKHQASLDQIKEVLVEVAGVDSNGIGKLDVRNYYTLVDLPDGMPADIFFLLSETEIQNQKLNIKRIKFQRRYHRRSSRR